MKKLKFLLLGFAGIALLAGCKKDKNIEYFYFKANGKEYKYHQIEEDGSLFHPYPSYTLWAGSPPGESYYQIIGSKSISTIFSGQVTFTFNEGLPSQDTVILDGLNNHITIKYWDDGNYEYHDGLPEGRIIFKNKSSELVSGTFEFHVARYRKGETLTDRVYTDTLLHITEGEFSIIPKL